MFQRLKGAIDSRIAEEQARQKALASSPLARSLSSLSRAESREYSQNPIKEKRQENGVDAEGADPYEFEKAFIIEDEEEMAPKELPEAMPDQSINTKEINTNRVCEENTPGDNIDPSTTSQQPRLSTEIKAKLRKLERLETKYQELLRSYRVAHARAISIEVFEKQLKEYTPLSTISDPDAFVEYLNQLKLKSDIIMDEFKRVSGERDEYKKKYDESIINASKSHQELAALKSSTAKPQSELVEYASNILSEATSTAERPANHTLDTYPQSAKEIEVGNKNQEEIFSLVNEEPSLQIEIKEKTSQVEVLKSTVSELENKIIISEKKSSGLNESLMKAICDLEEAKVNISKEEFNQEKIDSQAEEIRILKNKLEATEIQVSVFKTELENKQRECEEKLKVLKDDFAKREQDSAIAIKNLTRINEEAEVRYETLEQNVDTSTETKENNVKLTNSLENDTTKLANIRKIPQDLSGEDEQMRSRIINKDGLDATIAVGSSKKKGKKKKKSVPISNNNITGLSNKATDITSLESEINELKLELKDRDSRLAKAQTKCKTEEDLREEIENLKENLINIGQEHVEAKEKIKGLLEERRKLQEKIGNLESDLVKFNIESEKTQKLEVELKNLATNYDELKLHSSTLEADLGAAQQLATSRYKDLTDLRELLQKMQPELTKLRAECSEIKSTRDELTSRISELKRLETREKDLKTEIAIFRKQATDSQSEIRALHEKITSENNARLRAEDQQRVAQRDMRKSEAEKIKYAATSEKSALELLKSQEEATNLRSRVGDLLEQVSNLNSESTKLREESDLRASKYENAQALLGSMKDQVSEMAIQLREAESQYESLSEELSEVQRLLSERTREGETMRRLLAEIDDRAEAKVRESQEKMEAAIEELDRALDEASSASRRRARESDEIKNRLRDLEQDLQNCISEKAKLERAEIKWKSQYNDLEILSSNLSKEVEDVRAAMNQLRNALDGSEKAVKLAEKQKLDLRGALDNSNQLYESLQKEYKVLHVKLAKLNEPSERWSLDSKRGSQSRHDIVDFAYLKTIMLQFLEHKDRNVQEILVKTVLKQLLNFDEKEQKRWIAAISTN
ncbi:Golgin IMH1 [Golovinomyces cichoracearum]|uniref:Golgin IMH1 n=1 Tax=Golovinomyces cichoracearum TaxID=62708 RepID=A0A420IKT2_9PEZI|nr:Golgin IMH1 [Golovinomyces cichoracearum]